MNLTTSIKLATIIASSIALSSAIASAQTLTDNFAARPTATGSGVTLTGNNSVAGVEVGEPNHGGARDRSIWGSWTAPANGSATITTSGSAFNTVLAVYVGTSINALSPVAQNNDVASGFIWSSVSFPVKQGVSYSIAVDGQGTTTTSQGAATVNLSFTAQPHSGSSIGTDMFANRPMLASTLAAIGTCNTRLAGMETDEQLDIGDRDKTVWWRWVCPTNGSVTIDTFGSQFNTTLSVYSGTNLTALTAIAINDDAPNTNASRVSFQAESGREYQIMVDGAGTTATSEGNLILNLAVTPNVSPAGIPGANMFVGRGQLGGSSAKGAANNTFFTIELNEPSHGSSRLKTAWWQWTAPTTGLVEIKTEGSDFDTFMAVYRGNSVNGLQLVVNNDNAPNVTWSRVSFVAQQGVSYQIMVDGRGTTGTSEGNIALSVNQAVPAGNYLRLTQAIEIEMPGLAGVAYQLQSSANLINWQDDGSPIQGTGQPIRLLKSTQGTAQKYFRYLTMQ